MSTWVGIIVETAGRDDFWQRVEPFGVHGDGPVGARVLVDCGAAFGEVQQLGRDLSRALGAETVAFAAQTTSDVHCLWTHRAGELVRALEYSRDEGGWLTWTGTPQAWESAYFFEDPAPELESDAEDERYARAKTAGDADSVRDLLNPSSTENLFRVCAALGVDAESPAQWKRPRRGILARLFG